MSDSSSRPVVIASNRGPLSFTRVDSTRVDSTRVDSTRVDSTRVDSSRVDSSRVESEVVGRRGGGGLVSGIAPLVEAGRASWIAAALSEADRDAIGDDGLARAAGLEVRLLDLDREDQRRYYDDISNSTLWFVHHGLFDLVRDPAYDTAWWEAWDSYRRVNHAFAEAISAHAPEGATVLVQDYHLTLLARRARTERDDLRFVHFHHTPFAGPDGFRVLPPEVRLEILDGLAGHDACGFHTAAWESNYRSCQRRFGEDRTVTFTSSLNSDIDDLRSVAASPACDEALEALEATIGDAKVVARVDRMELSKNIVRGFAAFDRLLDTRPDLIGDVVFVACCYPSRLGVEDYARYRDEVVEAAAAINERRGTDGWQPVWLMTDDDFPRSVAVLRRYDVLMVNPIRDGLNLVAKEGPMVNERDGQLLLSTEAGAHEELADAADTVFPFDIEGTAAVLGEALDRDPEQRTIRAGELRQRVTSRTPADWLADQLAAG